MEEEKEARVVMFYGDVAESIENQANFLGVSPDEYIEIATNVMGSILEPMFLVEQRITTEYKELLSSIDKLTELNRVMAEAWKADLEERDD